MYYANTHIHRPKHKIPVTVVTTDGEIFDGRLFTSGDQRIKDLLNGESQFIPFETLGSAIYLLNRDQIARVMPRQENSEESAQRDDTRAA